MSLRSRTVGTWSLLVATAVIAAGCVASGAGESASPSSGVPSSAPASPSVAPSGQPSASASPVASDAPTPSPSPSPSPSTGIAYPTGPNDLVFRMGIGGGFVPIGFDLTGLPAVSIYGDGRLMSPGPQIMIYPGPLLPNIQVQKLTPVAIQRLLAAADAAGLIGADGRFDATGIADAPTTTFVVNANGGRHVVSAYALFETDSTKGMDQTTIEARARLRGFVAQVGDLAKLVGASEISDGGAFQATAMRLIVTLQPDQPVGASPSPSAGNLVQTPVAWPLNRMLAAFGAPVGSDDPGAPRCGVVDGSDLDLLRPLLEKANVLTPWTSGGATFSLRARPLLPDESGCKNEAA